jgi:hypothetical protein
MPLQLYARYEQYRCGISKCIDFPIHRSSLAALEVTKIPVNSIYSLIQNQSVRVLLNAQQLYARYERNRCSILKCIDFSIHRSSLAALEVTALVSEKSI